MRQSAIRLKEIAAPAHAYAVLGRALILLVVVFVTLASASTLLAAGAKPSKPTARQPSGTIATTTPTFTWGHARGAVKYEMRVHAGSTQLLA